MPINDFGSISRNVENKLGTSSLVQKTYLRTNYIEGINKKDFHMTNQFEIKNIPSPPDSQGTASKSYVGFKFNDPSITRKLHMLTLMMKISTTFILLK